MFSQEELIAISKGEKGDTGETGATGSQGSKGDKGDPGDVIINPVPTSDISTANYPLGVYCFGGASSGANNPFVAQTIFGFNQNMSRHTQFSAHATNGSLRFRTAHTSLAFGWSDWAEIFNSRDLTLGTSNHSVYGQSFLGTCGEYRFSDSVFQRYFLSFNAYASSGISSGYRFKNTGWATWIDQRSATGDIWFNTSTASGNAGEQITARSLFQFQASTQRLLFYQRLNLSNLPTSATGLVAGDVWRDSNGFLRVV